MVSTCKFVAAAAIVGVLLSGGCGYTRVVSVDGSSTVFLISAAIAEQMRDDQPGVNVVVGQSGTGGGFKKLAAGEIDVCSASRRITEDEARSCRAAGIEFVELKVAFDGLAVVVNPQNKWCDEITVDQLKTIWRKESEDQIQRWSDVDPDWPKVELKLYGPGPDSGTYDYFTEVINGKAKSSRQDYSPSENDNALVTGVAGDQGSLGYFGLGYYIENKDKLKLLAVDGGEGPQIPTPEKVRDGTYRPLSRPLFIYVRLSSLRTPDVAKYVQYYLENAKQVAPQVGYVPVTEAIARENQQRFESALQTAAAAKDDPEAPAA